jgi:hypothetical protein
MCCAGVSLLFIEAKIVSDFFLHVPFLLSVLNAREAEQQCR